jgi:diaminohydroxyphosphoribosylaminopyrimidine deaminase/5-amino-6-(5-phosphoribosylamino)uracil reductase
MDTFYMSRALDLARLGSGFTSPNPLVGAVVVKDGQVIGEGWHQAFGSPHAEINAFKGLAASPEGATLYVTLEPCSHFGKTPPCVDAIIAHKLSRVVIAMTDPNALVSGKGISKLKAHGIAVTVGVMEAEARKLNEIFIKYITTKEPFCLLKTAMTLDGKIATAGGDSQWITNITSRQHVHGLRQRYSSIMVGIGTVLADNPQLTTRLSEGASADPHRIIVDSTGRIPLDAKVLSLQSSAKTIIATTNQAHAEKLEALKALGATILILPTTEKGVDLKALMIALGQLDIDSVLIEGGSELNFSALEAGIVDKVCTFIAPKLLGGRDAKTPVGGVGRSRISECIPLRDMTVSTLDGDVMLEAYIQKEDLCLQDS